MAMIEGQGLYIEYCIDLFKEETIQRWFYQYEKILNHLVENEEILIKDLSVLHDEEQQMILTERKETKTSYPNNLSISECFEKIVNLHPYSMAIKDQETSISYKDLNAKSNQMAHFLKQRGVKQGDYVALSLAKRASLAEISYEIIKDNLYLFPASLNSSDIVEIMRDG